MTNKPIPYEGSEKHCFISYCHKNQEIVFQMMKMMAGHGCRFWYDAGIPIGSEFPEVIAEHLMQAEVCIAFLSNAYMQSDFCRLELNYALKKKKKLMLLYIEYVNLTSGFEMRLDMIQSVLMYLKNDLDAVIEEICGSEIIVPCIGHMHQEDFKEALALEKSIDAYIFSIQLLEKAKNANEPELKKVVYELKKINGFLRNESDFGEGNPEVLSCEYKVQQALHEISIALDSFLDRQNKDQETIVLRMLKSCLEVTTQLKIRAEKMKK